MGAVHYTIILIYYNSNLGCRYGSEYMGVYCYADDISLPSPTFSGLKERDVKDMRKLC